jgi:hypothetical protein
MIITDCNLNLINFGFYKEQSKDTLIAAHYFHSLMISIKMSSSTEANVEILALICLFH